MFFGARCQENSCNSPINSGKQLHNLYICCSGRSIVFKSAPLIKKYHPTQDKCTFGVNRVNFRSFGSETRNIRFRNKVWHIRIQISPFKFIWLISQIKQGGSHRWREVPTCRPHVEEGSHRWREVPTCRPHVEGGSHRWREVPTCLSDVEGGSHRWREVPTCLSDVEGGSHRRREVPTCRPAYQM